MNQALFKILPKKELGQTLKATMLAISFRNFFWFKTAHLVKQNPFFTLKNTFIVH